MIPVHANTLKLNQDGIKAALELGQNKTRIRRQKTLNGYLKRNPKPKQHNSVIGSQIKDFSDSR